jgi:hypothetical protein
MGPEEYPERTLGDSPATRSLFRRQQPCEGLAHAVSAETPAIRLAASRLQENDTITGSSTPWQRARLAALDLEGSGVQDRDNEAILEIAVVPLAEGQPDLSHAYSTLVNRSGPCPEGTGVTGCGDAPASAVVQGQLFS